MLLFIDFYLFFLEDAVLDFDLDIGGMLRFYSSSLVSYGRLSHCGTYAGFSDE